MKWLIEIDQIPAGNVRQLWADHRTLFDKFWQRDTIGDLYSQANYIHYAEVQKRQCWVGHNNRQIECIGFTMLLDYPNAKIAEVEILVSYERIAIDWNRVIHQHIEPWAKEQGCEFVYVPGRRGWLKTLDGYEEISTIARKRL